MNNKYKDIESSSFYLQQKNSPPAFRGRESLRQSFKIISMYARKCRSKERGDTGSSNPF